MNSKAHLSMTCYHTRLRISRPIFLQLVIPPVMTCKAHLFTTCSIFPQIRCNAYCCFLSHPTDTTGFSLPHAAGLSWQINRIDDNLIMQYKNYIYIYVSRRICHYKAICESPASVVTKLLDTLSGQFFAGSSAGSDRYMPTQICLWLFR